MLKDNQTFRVAAPTWANACVGENGSPQQIEYAEGFAAATSVLIRRVLEDQARKLSADIFVYPICFNMRHAVELYLKTAVDQIRVLGSHRNAKIDFDSNGTHDLEKIWVFVKSKAPEFDARYSELLQTLDGYITDIAAVDATGQVFRYPYSTENQKHLTEVAVINLGVLHKRFGELQDHLKSLYRLGEQLVEEYSWKSFTSKLSRNELLSIALTFPAKANWDSAEFTDRRAAIMEAYGLSKNDFSRALNVIKENFEMAALIGSPRALMAVDESLLFDFFDFWIQEHDLELVKNPQPPPDEAHELGDLFEWLKQSHIVQQACWDKMRENLTAEKLAELQSLFYFNRSIKYSEAFVQMRDYAVQEFQADTSAGRPQWKESLLHLLDKTNALENMLNSLSYLGQRTLVVALINRLGIQDAAERLLEHSVANSWLTRRLGSTGIAS